MGSNKIKIEMKNGFKWECEGPTDKLIDAGIEVLKTQKKLNDVTY